MRKSPKRRHRCHICRYLKTRLRGIGQGGRLLADALDKDQGFLPRSLVIEGCDWLGIKPNFLCKMRRMAETTAISQETVFAFLQNPSTHHGAAVTRIDTHCASVFLAGADVYKVKRAVHYPYLDFSTLARRKAACLAELDVNATNAPDLYLGVVPVTLKDGCLALGGDGDIVEWTVHLRRFDEQATLDRLSEKGNLPAAMIDLLAKAVVLSHHLAPVRNNLDAVSQLAGVIAETAAALAAARDVIAPDLAAALASGLHRRFAAIQGLLRRRVAAGFVRRCHGDLHLGNIASIAGTPVLFDAIEFNDAIATCDVLYDLSYLVMDLWERGLRSEANLLLNRYLVHAPGEEYDLQLEGLAALPLFMSLRAAIRAKVLLAQSALGAANTAILSAIRTYAETAAACLVESQPRLIAVGGLSGTGKTALSQALAPAIGRPPGAVHLRSDVERKRFLGADETAPLGADAYRPEVTAALYDRLRQYAQMALRAGQAVIIDATHRNPAERQATADLAASLGVPFAGLWLQAPAAVLISRVSARKGDASDATAAVVASQLQADTGRIGWPRLDSGQDRTRLLHQAMSLVTTRHGRVSP